MTWCRTTLCGSRQAKRGKRYVESCACLACRWVEAAHQNTVKGTQSAVMALLLILSRCTRSDARFVT